MLKTQNCMRTWLRADFATHMWQEVIAAQKMFVEGETGETGSFADNGGRFSQAWFKLPVPSAVLSWLFCATKKKPPAETLW